MAADSTRFKRYALYVTPTETPWAGFAQAWLDGDLNDAPELPLPLSEITVTPRRYGLHGTVVPPFYLADSEGGAAALTAKAAAFCAAQKPVATPGLALSQLGRFLALTPKESVSALRELADAALELCDPFRASLSKADLERHLAKGLTPLQDALLRRWGYPYVRDAFRFHITLTSRLPKRDLPTIREVLNTRLTPLLPQPWVVDHLSLVGEDERGRFHVIERFPLGAPCS